MLLRSPKGQRITATGSIDQVARNLQTGEDLPYTEYVIADLFWKERRVRPGEPGDLNGRVETMGVVEEKLKELELTMCEHRLAAFVPYHPTIRIQPESLEVPDTLIPQVQPCVIPRHLRFDEADILVGGSLSDRMQLGQLALDPIQQAQLETDQVVVDAHPVAGIFPVLGFDVLTLQGQCDRLGAIRRHVRDYTKLVADLLTRLGVSEDHDSGGSCPEQTRHRRRDQGRG